MLTNKEQYMLSILRLMHKHFPPASMTIDCLRQECNCITDGTAFDNTLQSLVDKGYALRFDDRRVYPSGSLYDMDKSNVD